MDAWASGCIFYPLIKRRKILFDPLGNVFCLDPKRFFLLVTSSRSNSAQPRSFLLVPQNSSQNYPHEKSYWRAFRPSSFVFVRTRSYWDFLDISFISLTNARSLLLFAIARKVVPPCVSRLKNTPPCIQQRPFFMSGCSQGAPFLVVLLLENGSKINLWAHVLPYFKVDGYNGVVTNPIAQAFDRQLASNRYAPAFFPFEFGEKTWRISYPCGNQNSQTPFLKCTLFEWGQKLHSDWSVSLVFPFFSLYWTKNRFIKRNSLVLSI